MKSMRISNRVKRNISLTLGILGIFLIIATCCELAMGEHTKGLWFTFAGLLINTYFCFDSYRMFRRRIAHGILFGRK